MNGQKIENTFEVTLSVKKSQLYAREDIVLLTKVKNVSGVEAKFYKYHTPFEGIANKIFEVKRNGKPLSYQGMLKRRTPPKEKDYIVLKPGDSEDCKVKLQYNYGIKEPGTYTIHFIGSSISGLPDSNIVTFEVH